jgi:histidine ammonia-lyase
MTGIGLVNIIKAKKLLNTAIITSTLINEIVSSFDDHFSDILNNTKQHSGQIEIARKMQKQLKNSKLIRKRDEVFYKEENINNKFFKQKVQEYYSLRCVPQILGPIKETIDNAEKILIEEINSVNDNPVIDFRTNNIYHGGNFHGDYISFEMDKLKIAITKLTMLIERQLNYILNNKLNEILPPFVNLGKLGFNLGMQGSQFVATSTTAENQTLSNPMYIHSIPNNNDNQDIVSMGTNSALMAAKVIDNAFQVAAVYALSLAQAIDYLKIQNKLADNNYLFYQKIRNIVPVFTEDNIKYNELNKIKNELIKN